MPKRYVALECYSSAHFRVHAQCSKLEERCVRSFYKCVRLNWCVQMLFDNDLNAAAGAMQDA